MRRFASSQLFARGALLCRLSLTVCIAFTGLTDAVWADLEGEHAPEVPGVALSRDTEAAHAQLFVSERFPSATACRTCHPSHYREWSASQHAYAQLSPVFNSMQGKILKLTNGTVGDFCIRCHTPIGMTLGEPPFTSNLNRHATSNEGVTCVVCHRVNQEWGKMSGRQGLVEGSLTQLVYGPTGNQELKRVLSRPDLYRVTTEPAEAPEQARPADAATRADSGRPIHGDIDRFFRLEEPAFCGSCHDVTLVDGFRLEEAFSEYKISPAAARGATCQGCHMGVEPGRDTGYRNEPAALVGGVPTKPRKRTNHRFVGPDYSIVHPGLFPVDDRAQELASMAEWLTFDWRAGWGTPEFELAVPPDTQFPEHWRTADARYAARRIVTGHLELLEETTAERLTLLRNGYKLGPIVVERASRDGLVVAVDVSNGTDGHNVPTGFTAERIVFLHAVVRDADGRVVFESGDLDINGDLRDIHSTAVRLGAAPFDDSLFSLQSKFITRNVRGGEREQILAVNRSMDPLPFVRPDARPSVLQGRTGVARIHKKGIPPLTSRRHAYTIDAAELGGPGPYHVTVELKSGMVPVNLISDIMDVGFDYGMSPREVAREVVRGYRVLWSREASVELEPRLDGPLGPQPRQDSVSDSGR